MESLLCGIELVYFCWILWDDCSCLQDVPDPIVFVSETSRAELPCILSDLVNLVKHSFCLHDAALLLLVIIEHPIYSEGFISCSTQVLLLCSALY